jgi:hypothetical protein
MVLGDMIRIEPGTITCLGDSQTTRILFANVATTIVKMVEYTDFK